MQATAGMARQLLAAPIMNYRVSQNAPACLPRFAVLDSHNSQDVVESREIPLSPSFPPFRVASNHPNAFAPRGLAKEA